MSGIGLFVSSFTENQLIAVAGSFSIFILLWIINWPAQFIGQPIVSAVLNYVAIPVHFDDFTKGVFDTKHIFYFLSICSFKSFSNIPFPRIYEVEVLIRMNKLFLKIAGFAGIVLLVSGLIKYYTDGFFSTATIIVLMVGLALTFFNTVKNFELIKNFFQRRAYSKYRKCACRIAFLWSV